MADPGHRSAADYYNPGPALAIGLQMGAQMAQRRYQDQATQIAARRAAVDEQRERRLETQTQIAADRIQEELDAQENYKFQFNRALNEELSVLDPAARGKADELEKANRRAYQRTVSYLPPKALQQSMESSMRQGAMDERNAAVIEGKLAAVDARLSSQEWTAILRDDAKQVSEDEYVNRHLNAHAKQSKLPMVQADADLRAIYRRNKAEKRGETVAPVAAEDLTPDTVSQLERAKAAKVKRVIVKKDGSVSIADSWNPWAGTDINEALSKAKKEKEIKGGGNSPAKTDTKRRVYEYDSKTGGIKK
jgi:hypothetical protein